MVVDKFSFSSNNVRLLKHLDRLGCIRVGLPVSPVMFHLSLTNRCNLSCGYCCYGGRVGGLDLSFGRALSAVEQFGLLGVKGLELTGGGEASPIEQTK